MPEVEEQKEKSQFDEIIEAIDRNEVEIDRHISVQLETSLKDAVHAAKTTNKKASVTIKISVYADHVARPLVLCEYMADAARREVRLTAAEAKKLSARRMDRHRPLGGRYMYRSCSRLTLEIESVRVERLQDISEDDARAEGVEPALSGYGADSTDSIVPVVSYRKGFERLWGEINGAESWSANPWVWVVGFKRVES